MKKSDKKNMNWTDVLIEYCNNNNLIKCPKCGENTLRTEKILNSLTIICDNCGAARHFDGTRP